MPKVKVMVKNNQAKVRVPVGIRLLIRRCCQAVLDSTMFPVWFLSYRKKDRVTDVLSFPLGQNGHYDTNKETGCALLGDVVISLETAMKQARMYGHSLEREIGFLTVHSMLHLLGYDHETSPLEERQMREKEEEVLGALGISREATFTQTEGLDS